MQSREKFFQMSDKCVDELVNLFEQNMYEDVLCWTYRTDEFLARHNSIWGKAFVAQEIMYIMAVEAAEAYSKEIGNIKECDKKHTFFALQHINARACQQFNEILCLMKNGFADGAFARWRSMYELSVYAIFISQNGEDVAKSYIAQENTDEKTLNGRNQLVVLCCLSMKKRHLLLEKLLMSVDFLQILEKYGKNNMSWQAKLSMLHPKRHLDGWQIQGRDRPCYLLDARIGEFRYLLNIQQYLYI